MEEIYSNIFKKQLLKEEKILWSGKPNINKLYSKKDAFSIFYGIGMIGGGLVGIVNGIRIMKGLMVQNTSKPMSWNVSFLFSIPFFVIGLYHLIGKQIRRRHTQEKTFYAITNKRLLIVEASASEKVISKYISQINKVDVITNNNEIGTIEFGENYPDGEFSDIKDVQNVYELINDLRSKI